MKYQLLQYKGVAFYRRVSREVNSRLVTDLRYFITVSLRMPYIDEYMGLKLHHEIERKQLVDDE